MPKNEKRVQASRQIRELIEQFGRQLLDRKHFGFALELLGRMERKRKLGLERGRPEIWGAAVVYVIARLNFLFDPDIPQPLTPKRVCCAFGAKQRTVSQKATRIEKALDLCLGEEGLCRPEITEMLTLVELPGGLIVPQSMIPAVVDDFFQQVEERRQERLRMKQEARQAAQAKAAAEKRRRWRQVQPSLFADF